MIFAPNAQLNLSVDLWFFNSGGSSTPNDTLYIYVTNGLGDTILLHKQYENTSNWKTLIINDIQKR